MEENIPPPKEMTLEERFEIVRSVGEECIQEHELLNLLANKPQPVCYDGFEPSGRMHIAQGVMKTLSVKKLVSAGCKVKIMIADWFASLNGNMGGDLDKIQTVGRYFIEIWKAVGMNLEGGQVEFLWSSEEIDSRPNEYWLSVMDIARKNPLNATHMRDQHILSAAQILNPCMQCADIFFLKADICQSGMDQREVNVLAREYCNRIKRKNKPIILSHHMLLGLKKGQEKMSKSDLSSAIFMEDKEQAVIHKINKAYCPPNVIEKNPCLEYLKYIVFPWFNEFKVERKAENQGEKTFTSFEELAADYEKGVLSPADLKPALSKAINMILQPVRDHFENDKNAKALFEMVESFTKPQNDQTLEANKAASMEENIPPPKEMTLEERFKIVRSVGEECIQEHELLNLLANKPQPICYDGFEPSGRMHIAQGVMKTLSVNKMVSAGCNVKILIADWFAFLNDKMGGDLDKIQTVGRYFIEIWKAVGMNLGGQVEFLWSSKEINSRHQVYWPSVIDIARKNKLTRIMRCSKVMGRDENKLSAAQIIYPCMQCADIFFLKADICQLGMDQRKVNVLSREYCNRIKRKNKPIILSHHMLLGLKKGQEKMSKSDPSSAIFMEDKEEVVIHKISNAYCPPNVVEKNPCLDYLKYIVFPWFNEFKVEVKAENRGEKFTIRTFTSFEELAADYEKGDLSPADLKPALSKAINTILQPVRDHFENDKNAKALFKTVKGFMKTQNDQSR